MHTVLLVWSKYYSDHVSPYQLNWGVLSGQRLRWRSACFQRLTSRNMGAKTGQRLAQGLEKIGRDCGKRRNKQRGQKQSKWTAKRRPRTPGRYDRELVNLQRGLVDKPPSRVIGTGRQWAARRWQGPPCTCVGGNAAALKT